MGLQSNCWRLQRDLQRHNFLAVPRLGNFLEMRVFQPLFCLLVAPIYHPTEELGHFFDILNLCFLLLLLEFRED